jgi:hypothetical protein
MENAVEGEGSLRHTLVKRAGSSFLSRYEHLDDRLVLGLDGISRQGWPRALAPSLGACVY